MASPEEYSRLCLPTLFNMYFDMAFLLSYCPFQLILKVGNGNIRYMVTSSFHRKIICALFHVSTCLWLARSIFQSIPYHSKTPSAYFEFIYSIFNMTNIVFTQILFWFHQRRIVKMLNYIVNRRNSIRLSPNTRTSFLLKKPTGYFVFFICTGFAFVNSAGTIYEEAVNVFQFETVRENTFIKFVLAGIIGVGLVHR